MNLYIFNNYINNANFVLKSLITKEDFSGMVKVRVSDYHRLRRLKLPIMQFPSW